MTPELWAAIAVAGLPGLFALIASVLNGRKLNQITIQINGRLTELLALTSKSSKAEGVLEGKNPTKESGQ